MLLGIPFFYLLTFVGSAEESEVEIGAMSAVLGLAIVLLAWQERSYQSSGLLLTLVLYLWYTTRVLPGLRVFKHVVRGVSHSNIGRYRPALEAFHHALQLDPQNSLARESMARLHRTLDLEVDHFGCREHLNRAELNFKRLEEGSGLTKLQRGTLD